MIFTSKTFIVFFILVYILYWLLKKKKSQNILLLIGSYIFYGWIHPWFCILIAISTVVDYYTGLKIYTHSDRKKRYLFISLFTNLGMLFFFKYFNFFVENVYQILVTVGLDISYPALKIFLPVGISFYTFQTLSYTIDIYKGKLKPTDNFIDFAVFVSFFPQLVAGPIERAKRFLPQIEKERRFSIKLIESALPLLIRGFFKKIVIADNIAIYVDQVYLLEKPSVFVLFAATLAFSLQILADFSAYTDIARGLAKLLGFDLIKNFNKPYFATSPADFWKRWHISFSTWIRDYLYIPLGGSRVNSEKKYFMVLLITFGLSGLWHGAAWNFILWGVYHAIIFYIYYKFGITKNWKPATKLSYFYHWGIMFFLTLIGWMIFRAHSVAWLFAAFKDFSSGFSNHDILVGTIIIAFVFLYSLPMLIYTVLDKFFPKNKWAYIIMYSISLFLIVLLYRENGRDFIYFQF